LNSEIQAELSTLDSAHQQRVLAFVRSLKQQVMGTRGRLLMQFAGAISRDELRSIEEAIESGCEQVALLIAPQTKHFERNELGTAILDRSAKTTYTLFDI